MLNTLIHHCEAVLHLRFQEGMMVTCSKVPTDVLLIYLLTKLQKTVNLHYTGSVQIVIRVCVNEKHQLLLCSSCLSIYFDLTAKCSFLMV